MHGQGRQWSGKESAFRSSSSPATAAHRFASGTLLEGYTWRENNCLAAYYKTQGHIAQPFSSAPNAHVHVFDVLRRHTR
uniref:Uncharacterized protein n=1 Tax=Anguilla anguilla TaxID=7936 RepID=A0A0E9SP97_ANGAN